MKTWLPIFFVLIFSKNQSQIVFCPPGAEWHYYYFDYSFEKAIWRNEQISYVRDSVLGNETVKVLNHREFFKDFGCLGGNNFSVIKQKGDTVFFRSKITSDNWQVLYNYAALPGQQWTNTITLLPVITSSNIVLTNTYTVTVDSVRTAVVNSFNLKRLYVRFTGYIYNFSGTLELNTDTVSIDERIGCNQFLFNFYNRRWNSECYDLFDGFLCYKDDAFGTKLFSEKPCNYSDYAGINENNYQNLNIKIHPNPITDFITISVENELINGESLASISDLCGREIKQLTLNNLNSGSVKVDISDLANGVYILSLKNFGQSIYTGKLLKND